MPSWPIFPIVYEINTWVWLNSLSNRLNRPVTLANVPEEELEHLASFRFDGIWLMGVWERSPAAQKVAIKDARLRPGYDVGLPDWSESDIVGSPYAIHSYRVDRNLGGDDELSTLREKLNRVGLRLMLDFVPNHFALDHPWLDEYPERFVQGSEDSLERNPVAFFRAEHTSHSLIFAHGRDRYFDPWPDTVQLDYRRSDAREAMSETLRAIADRCDGVRCDMAMLQTSEVFREIWGGAFAPPEAEFWPTALGNVKRVYPDFLALGEVYWGLEYKLQQLGFDYTYDKHLYDRLVEGDASGVRIHLHADPAFQQRLARFVENHDEGRAAAIFGLPRGRAASILAFTLPGLRLIHHGQLDGYRLKLPVQLGREISEQPDPDLRSFYRRLIDLIQEPILRDGKWWLIEPRSAWQGNSSYTNFVAHAWILGEEVRVVVVNLSWLQAECLLELSLPWLANKSWDLLDLLNDAQYVAFGDELVRNGLFVKLPGFGYHMFRLRPRAKDLPDGVKIRRTSVSHQQGIYGIAWSRDAEFLVTAHVDSTIKIWPADDATGLRELSGHKDVVNAVAWSPVKQELASVSNDRTVRLWQISRDDHQVIGTHHTELLCVDWSPDGRLVASGSLGGSVHIDAPTGEDIYVFRGHQDAVNTVAWRPDGKVLASGSGDGTIAFWDIVTRSRRGEPLRAKSWISSVAWSPSGDHFVAGSGDGTICLWGTPMGPPLVVLEGHTDRVLSVTFSPDGRVLVSKSADNTIRFWNPETWQELAVLEQRGEYLSGLTFHPRLPILAARDDWMNSIFLFDLDLDALLRGHTTGETIVYTNAKVVLLGDSSAGKTCLFRALLGKPFEPQSASHGMEVASYRSEPVQRCDGGEVFQETFLWDLAGQPFSRLINTLFLDQTALALIVFDASRSDNPLNGVTYWAKTFRRLVGPDRPSLLIAGRTDASPVAIPTEVIERVRTERGFSKFIATSAAMNYGIAELREAVAELIPWDLLPATSSPELWKRIREYLLDKRNSDDLLMRGTELRDAYRARYPADRFDDADFEQVVTLAEAQGLVVRLSFGGFVLLRPELLDNYASAIVRQALNDPQGLGFVSERDIFGGKLNFGPIKRVDDPNTERLLLYSVIELLLDRQVAMREESFLVFPHVSLRSPPPDPELTLLQIAVFSFDGPSDVIYTTLVIRLVYGEAFELEGYWQYTADFRDAAGRRYRIQLVAHDEGHADLLILSEEAVSTDNTLLILRFTQRHLLRRALPDSVTYERIYTCPECRKPIPRDIIKYRRQHGKRYTLCVFCQEKRKLIRLVDELDELMRGIPDVPEIEALDRLEREVAAKTETEVGLTTAAGKAQMQEFDVFLAHSSQDKIQIEKLAGQLKRRGISVWLDHEQIAPGRWWQDILQAAIRQVKTAAIIIGPGGLGDWERLELRAFLQQCVERNLPVIPVLLPGVIKIPTDLPFLGQFQQVRFNQNIEEDGSMEQLIFGITGVRPSKLSGLALPAVV